MTDWAKWESQVINGVFPLRRFLGRSNHSVVFLTEFKAQNVPDAAIKILPAVPSRADAQLSRWKTVAALSHPHLIRLFDCGRCRLGGHDFLWVVMEYAEQTLAQILPHRSLTHDEAREMLVPTLDALAFLHRNGLVQGQLKPPNVLAVNDQLKLATDTVQRVGESMASLARSSVYDAPEAKTGGISAAGDVWGLGVTLVEALTQHPPAWSDERLETAALPATLPSPFVDTVARALSQNPAERPTISELEAQFRPARPVSVDLTAQPTEQEAPGRADPAPSAVSSALAPSAAAPSAPAPSAPAPSAAAPSAPAPSAPAPSAAAPSAPAPSAAAPSPPTTRWLRLAIAAGLVILLAVWAGSRMFRSHSDTRQQVSDISQSSPQPADSPAAASPAPADASENPKVAISAPAAVLHEEIPEVSRGARESIRGRIKVTVRVTVDRSGRVVKETLESSGSSRYFARLASEAARKWRFAPVESQDSRVWLLQFDFTRGGVAGRATPRA